MSLSVLIVDDEQLARDELAFLLRDIEGVDVLAQGKNGLEAVTLIREYSPDLVFLDVQMPGLDGFGVLKKLLEKKLPLPQIVFATAFDQYAVKAFEVNALDYLLKPFDKKRVVHAIEKARKHLEGAPGTDDEVRYAAEGAGRTASAACAGAAEGEWAFVPGGSEGHLLCLHRRRDYHRGGSHDGRPVELPHPGRTAGRRSIPIFSGVPTVRIW